MRRIVPALVLLALPLLSLARDEQEICLPEDGKVIVLSFDLERVFGPPRKTAEPALSVFADGKILARTPLAGGDAATGKLDRTELQKLLSYVVAEQRFFEHDREAIRKKMQAQAGERTPMVLDGATTVITVTLADRSHTAREYGLDFAGREYSDVAELVRLAKVSERLNRLRVVTIAGGPKKVEEYVALVRASVENRKSDFLPPTADDLADAWVLPDGGRRVRFRQVYAPPEMEGKSRGRLVTVVDSGKGDPEITLHRYGPEK